MRGRIVLVTVTLLATAALTGCLTPGGDGGAGGSDGNPFTPNGRADAAPYDPGWPAVEDATIRPGVQVVSETGQCTSNFVYRSPDNRTLYLGIAAHCVSEDAVGKSVDIAGGAATGVVAYTSWGTMKDLGMDDATLREINDFALVEIPDESRMLVHPAVLHYGGPTALADGAGAGDRVITYGNSGLRQGIEPTNPREGVVIEADEWYTTMYILTPGVPGDSGSGVLTGDGRALGVLIHLQIAPTAGGNGAVNLAKALAWAEEHAEFEARLATWPLLAGGVVPLGADAPEGALGDAP